MPNRAWLDNRLSKLHLRVLGVIAMHARFGDNGLGCTLSSRRIGEKIEALHHKVAVARRDLVKWGYLDEHPHPTKKQMFMHLVVFDLEADADAISSKTGPAEVSGSTETGTFTGTGLHDEPVPPQVPVEIETGTFTGTGTAKTGTSQGTNKILTSKVREDIGLKPIEDIPLGRGVSPDGDPRDDDDSDLPISAELAIFERRLPKIRSMAMPTDQDLENLAGWHEWLMDVAAEHGAHEGDPIGGWALRLSGEVKDIVDDLEEYREGSVFETEADEQEQAFR